MKISKFTIKAVYSMLLKQVTCKIKSQATGWKKNSIAGSDSQTEFLLYLWPSKSSITWIFTSEFLYWAYLRTYSNPSAKGHSVVWCYLGFYYFLVNYDICKMPTSEEIRPGWTWRKNKKNLLTLAIPSVVVQSYKCNHNK